MQRHAKSRTQDYVANASTYAIRWKPRTNSMPGGRQLHGLLSNDLSEDTDGDGFSEADEVPGIDNDASSSGSILAWYGYPFGW